MDKILRDTSPAALISAIEDNLFAIIPSFSMWPQAEVYDGAEIKWSLTRIQFPMFNSVFRAQLAPQQVDSTIQAVIARARERKVPVLWWTGPQTRPADLGRRLEANGFTSLGHEPGMAVDLMKLNENWAALPGLSIEQVNQASRLKVWCRTCVQGFGMPDFVEDAFFDFMSHVGFRATRPYLALQDNQPVATSLMVLAAGVAGIYNVTTLPEARRKGFGTWVTLTPLCEARTMGYRVGILHASAMGVNLYRSLGFQEYCQIGHSLWSPAPGEN